MVAAGVPQSGTPAAVPLCGTERKRSSLERLPRGSARAAARSTRGYVLPPLRGWVAVIDFPALLEQ
jgi:hypothetical protein